MARAVLGASLLSLSLLGFDSCASPRHGDGSTEAQIAAASAATRAEDWKLAADLWYRVYLGDEGTTLQPYYETARALWRSGDPDSACSMIEQGLKVFPQDRGLMRLEAEILRSSGFRRAAERCYERLVALEPQNVEALTALGRLRLELGLESSAIEPLTRAVAISGGDAQVWLLLADAHRVAGNVLNAYRSYSRAFELGATESVALLAAARLCVDRRVQAAAPESLERGVHWLGLVVGRHPQNTRAHFLLGLLEEGRGRPQEAVRHYRRAVETDPSDLEALTNLAVLYHDLGDAEHTREMVERALALEREPTRRVALRALLLEQEAQDG